MSLLVFYQLHHTGRQKKKPLYYILTLHNPVFFEISMDNQKGVEEERKAHYQLQTVDGCDFLWNNEKKRLSPRWVRSRFLHVDFGVTMQSDE